MTGVLLESSYVKKMSRQRSHVALFLFCILFVIRLNSNETLIWKTLALLVFISFHSRFGNSEFATCL